MRLLFADGSGFVNVISQELLIICTKLFCKQIFLICILRELS